MSVVWTCQTSENNFGIKHKFEKKIEGDLFSKVCQVQTILVNWIFFFTVSNILACNITLGLKFFSFSSSSGGTGTFRKNIISDPWM